MVVDAGAGIFVVAVLTTLAVTGAIVFVKGPDGSSSTRQRRPASRPRKGWPRGAETRARTWSAVHDEDPHTPYHSVHSRPPFKYSEEAQFKVQEHLPEDEAAADGESQDQQDQYRFVPLEVEDYTPAQSEPSSFRRSPVWSKST